MRKICSLILFLTCALFVMGQTSASADKLFQACDYVAAHEQYGKLLKSSPNNSLYQYRYARCAHELGDFATALKYFDKVGDRYMLKYFYLGEIYLQLWNPDAAIDSYNKYLASLTEANERESYITERIAYAEKLQRYLRRVEKIQVLDSVQVPLDSILYSRGRRIRLSKEEGYLSKDSLGQIVYTNQRGDRRIWATPVDSSLILVSNHRLLDEWSTPDTLPSTINFTEQQSAPFLLSDGVTLYFAAKDSNGFGGLDIYVSRYNTATETYTTPENIGLPFNSPANEYLFVLDKTDGVGYLVTDRFAEEGMVHIYTFLVPESKQYWKDLPVDSLAAYAQLQYFEQGIYEDDPAVTLIDLSIDTMPEFSIVINDSTIYHSINDFCNPKAREKFIEWQVVEKQLKDEQEQIANLRLEYATADESRQKELTPIILQLENNRGQLVKRSQNLLLEIRALEIKVRQSLSIQQ